MAGKELIDILFGADESAIEGLADALEKLGKKERETLSGAALARAKKRAPITLQGVFALDKVKDDAMTAVFIELARYKDAETREYAVTNLGFRKGDAARAALHAALKDESDGVVREAIGGLKTHGDASAVAPMLAMLGAMSDKEKRDESLRVQGLLEALAELAPADADVLAALVAHADHEDNIARAAFAALRALGPKRAKKAVPALQKLEHSAKPIVHIHAHYTLAVLTGDLAPHAPHIIDHLDDKTPSVWGNAESALRELGASALPFVKAALKHKSPRVRNRAQKIVKRIEPQARAERGTGRTGVESATKPARAK